MTSPVCVLPFPLLTVANLFIVHHSLSNNLHRTLFAIKSSAYPNSKSYHNQRFHQHIPYKSHSIVLWVICTNVELSLFLNEIHLPILNHQTLENERNRISYWVFGAIYASSLHFPLSQINNRVLITDYYLLQLPKTKTTISRNRNSVACWVTEA